MTTLDEFLEAARPTPEEMQRRKQALEACRPAKVPQALLMLDEEAFLDAHRQRYGLPPSAGAWMEWYGAEKDRAKEMRRRRLVR